MIRNSNKKLQTIVEKAYRLDPRVAAYKEKLENERIAKEVLYLNERKALTRRKRWRRRGAERRRRRSRSDWRRREGSKSGARVRLAIRSHR